MRKNSIIFVCFWVVLFDLLSCRDGDKKAPYNKHDNNSILSWVSSHPNEEITKYKNVSVFLKRHKVYIALTTSPERIKHIDLVLKSIDLTHVENVILAIPRVFERDATSYKIPEAIENRDKLIVLHIDKDLGPITKLIPAVKYIKGLGDQESIVITIDDDTAYPIGMVNQMIKELAFRSQTALGASNRHISAWGLREDLWPEADQNVLEGYGGIAYRVGDVDHERMLEIVAKQFALEGGNSCYLSDDIVINYVLASRGIRRGEINNRFFNYDLLTQYSYGFEADALHRGAGVNRNTGIQGEADINRGKYLDCYRFMTKEFPMRDFQVCE